MKCPMLWAAPKEHVTTAECIEEGCAWWIKGESRPGGCCFPRIAQYLAAGLKPAQAQADALGEIRKEVAAMPLEIQRANRRF